MFIKYFIRLILSLSFFITVNYSCFAQFQDTLISYKPIELQKLASFIAPAIFVGYGLISLSDKSEIRILDLTTRSELQEDHPLFAAHVDNYIQFAPAVMAMGLNLDWLCRLYYCHCYRCIKNV